MNTERLIARVKAVNAAHQYAIELYPRLVDFFRPFVGQKSLLKTLIFFIKSDQRFQSCPAPHDLMSSKIEFIKVCHGQ